MCCPGPAFLPAAADTLPLCVGGVESSGPVVERGAMSSAPDDGGREGVGVEMAGWKGEEKEGWKRPTSYVFDQF